MSLTFNSILDYNDFVRGYSIMMFGMWGLGIQFPRLLLRYGKSYPMVINIHSVSMLMIGLLTIMYVIAQIAVFQTQYNGNFSSLPQAQYIQYILSIVLSAILVIQFLLGFLARVELFKSKHTEWLFFIKNSHKFVGWALWILGKVIVTLIIQARVSDIVFRGWLFGMAGMAILLVILQIFYRAQSRSAMLKWPFKRKNKQAKYHNEIYQRLLSTGTVQDNFQDRGVRYVIIDNSMYYIDEDFMHPGGQYIFSLLNGKEINYYLKGAKSIGPNYPRHLHTKYVTKYLENRLIGQLQVEPLLASQKIGGDSPDWKIVSTIKTNFVNTYLITFETDSGMVRETLKIQNFGKYIMMGCLSQEILSKTQRPYYLCFSLSEYQMKILDKLRKFYKYYYFAEPINQKQQSEKYNEQQLSPRLSFFIQEIKHGLFNRYLLNAPKQRIFHINGPYGKGLGLTKKSKGYLMLIAGGSGVTAFIDLFNFLIQKTLYELIKIKASSPSLRKINSHNINYDGLEQLKVMLVGTFESSDKFYLSTVIKELYYLNKKHSLKNFELILHYSSSQVEEQIKMVNSSFSKDYLKGILEEQQPDWIVFSGPTPLESLLRKLQPEVKLKSPIQFL